ncbi:MAG: hypothetical protein ABI972_31395 [Acidobacteriota bacterium]
MARYDSNATFDSGIRYDEPDLNPPPLGTMRNLPKFLEVPFDDHNISEAELLAFSTDNLQRMTANNPVVLATRIAATAAKLAIVAQCSSDNTLKLGARKAAKDAKDEFRKNLPEEIGKIYVVVIAKYGLNGTQVTEVFPNGRTVFAKSGTTDDLLGSKLTALVAVLTAKQADLGAPVVTEATALKTNWTALYEASEEKSGQKSTTEEGKRAARADLQLELYFNLIELMKMFPRQPEKLSLYMTQSLLEDHPHHAPPPTP